MLNFPFFRIPIPSFYNSYYNNYYSKKYQKYNNYNSYNNFHYNSVNNNYKKNFNENNRNNIKKNINNNNFNKINNYNYDNINKNTNTSSKKKKISSKYNSSPFDFINHILNGNNNDPIFEIFGIELYLDDIIILGLLFILYNEGVKDEMLFLSLVLLLLT